MCATEGTQWWIYDLGFTPDSSCTWETWEVEGQVGKGTPFGRCTDTLRLLFVTSSSLHGHENPQAYKACNRQCMV